MNLPVRSRNPKSEIRNPKSERRRLFGPVAIATLLGISMPDTVRADVVTFAQFSQRTVSDLDFSYTNRGSGADFDSVGQGIPIYLAITSGFAPGLDRLQSAHLFLTSSTTEATMSQTGGNLLLREHFTGLANSIQIVLDTPVNGKRNFLTMTFSDGLFSGRLNATEASLNASDADRGNPSRVRFLSDFIDFGGAIEQGFSLSFSSVNSSDGAGHLRMSDNGFFSSFTASGTGTFDTAIPAAAPVPEPASVVLTGFGLLGLLCFAVGYKVAVACAVAAREGVISVERVVRPRRPVSLMSARPLPYDQPILPPPSGCGTGSARVTAALDQSKRAAPALAEARLSLWDRKSSDELGSDSRVV